MPRKKFDRVDIFREMNNRVNLSTRISQKWIAGAFEELRCSFRTILVL